MYALLRRATPLFLTIAGVLWSFVTNIALFSTAWKPVAFTGLATLALAITGLHLHYRVYRTAFYEELGFVFTLIALLVTSIAVSIQAPTASTSSFGAVLNTLPWLAALGTLIPAIVLFAGSFTIVGILPRPVSAFLATALLLEYSVVPLAIGSFIPFRFPVLSLALIITGVVVYKQLSNGELTSSLDKKEHFDNSHSQP